MSERPAWAGTADEQLAKLQAENARLRENVKRLNGIQYERWVAEEIGGAVNQQETVTPSPKKRYPEELLRALVAAGVGGIDVCAVQASERLRLERDGKAFMRGAQCDPSKTVLVHDMYSGRHRTTKGKSNDEVGIAVSYESLRSGHRHTGTMRLGWEPDGAAFSDDYSPSEISAAELFRIWVGKYAKTGKAEIYWYLHCPHGAECIETWEQYFTQPTVAGSGVRVDFSALPVARYRWTNKQPDKAGFIDEYMGRPPVFGQTHFDVTQTPMLRT